MRDMTVRVQRVGISGDWIVNMDQPGALRVRVCRIFKCPLRARSSLRIPVQPRRFPLLNDVRAIRQLLRVFHLLLGRVGLPVIGCPTISHEGPTVTIPETAPVRL
jgi:hypothetical protein